MPKLKVKYIRIDLLDIPPGAHPMATPDDWIEDFKTQLERSLKNQGVEAQVSIEEETVNV